MRPEMDGAVATQARIEALEKKLKSLYGQRYPHLTAFIDVDQRSRGVLLGKHAANPVALGDYGFDVVAAPASGDDTEKPPKP